MIYKILSGDSSEYKSFLQRVDHSLVNSKTDVSWDYILNYYFDSDDYEYRIFGYFEQDTLKGCVFVRYSTAERYYLIEYFVKDNDVLLKDFLGIFQYILNYSENCGYYRFYSAYQGKLKTNRLWERLFKNKINIERYFSVTEIIIPKKTRSSFSNYWIWFQRATLFDNELIVHHYILKDQYRI